ncbi:MAG: acyl-CoA dehydrogenase family protein [Desulfomonilia bacterium]|jgi:alkylation response protein AidB-like acyl-CoA dehydrogenase|nr:acyl-CoA dehydrogenase family protein [Deltaproteobacteria bacterium]MDX9761702.1 acyl-CoA dehydrogenase family protein [Desulfomonilia bacterium]HPX18498.1 acyl-CoA dehydrogenase family protein [Deltaproteobacteria bacterium]
MYLLNSKEQKMFVGQLRRMVEDKVWPRAAEIDEKEEFPWDLKKIFQDMGLLGLAVPEEYGGNRQGHLYTCLAVEEIAAACVSSSLIVQGQALGWEPILIGGTEEQKKKYGPMVASGEKIISYGLTEPGAGSDSGAMATRAVKKGDRYVINGTKCFITNGPVADLITLFAMTDASKGVKGISAFVVPAEVSGFSVAKWEKKMGIKGSPTGELVFEDVEVPAEDLIGEEGKGFVYAMKTLDTSRPVIGAQACGLARGALELAIKYAKERVQFGRPIGNFQGIGWMLADMAAEVDAARSLVYQAARMVDENSPEKSYLSACSKLIASDVAMRVTTNALQIAGGYGYMREYPFERMMRDAKITQVYEGTNQIMKLIISRELLK